MSNSLVAGQIVTNNRAFTSLNGCHFLAGNRFMVDHVGEVNTRVYSEIGNCTVWIVNYCQQFAGTDNDGNGSTAKAIVVD